MGFLGGIAWAILVAKVQQLYPKEDLSGLVAKFFKTYLEWWDCLFMYYNTFEILIK